MKYRKLKYRKIPEIKNALVVVGKSIRSAVAHRTNKSYLFSTIQIDNGYNSVGGEMNQALLFNPEPLHLFEQALAGDAEEVLLPTRAFRIEKNNIMPFESKSVFISHKSPRRRKSPLERGRRAPVQEPPPLYSGLARSGRAQGQARHKRYGRGLEENNGRAV